MRIAKVVARNLVYVCAELRSEDRLQFQAQLVLPVLRVAEAYATPSAVSYKGGRLTQKPKLFRSSAGVLHGA